MFYILITVHKARLTLLEIFECRKPNKYSFNDLVFSNGLQTISILRESK